MRNSTRGVSCPNESCRLHGMHRQGKVVQHAPAMHAGLATKCLGFRDIFTARVHFVPFVILVIPLATPQQRGNLATRAA